MGNWLYIAYKVLKYAAGDTGLDRGVVEAEDATGMMETVLVGVGEWLKLSLALFDDDDETDSLVK